MIRADSLRCCGTRELDGIDEYDDPESILKDLATGEPEWIFKEHQKFRFVYFTCISKDRIGSRLAKLIQDHNLGTIIETSSCVNPNTSHKIKVWVWTINWRNLNKYWRKSMTYEEARKSLNAHHYWDYNNGDNYPEIRW